MNALTGGGAPAGCLGQELAISQQPPIDELALRMLKRKTDFAVLDAAYTCRMEVVGFEVDGTRFGFEPQHARIFSQKLREFARGEYAGDLAEIKRRTGLDAAEWLDGAVPLADRIDRCLAEDRTDAI
jgi:hypothetical protein